MVDDVVKSIAGKFRTFGGGYESPYGNPLAMALKNEPLQFAAGVDVRSVVDFIVAQLGQQAAPAPSWQDIETCPRMQTVLLFAWDGDGHWKMDSGFWHDGFDNETGRAGNYTPWNWGGKQLKIYETQPTLWHALPAPPVRDKENA